MLATHPPGSSAPLRLQIDGWHRLGSLPEIATATLDGPFGFRRAVQLGLLGDGGTRASVRAARVDLVRRATSVQHGAIQPTYDVLATALGDVAVVGPLDGFTLAEMRAEGTPISVAAAYTIGLDLADAALYLCEGREATTRVAFEPSDVVISTDGRVRVVAPVLLHLAGGRPLARASELRDSILQILRDLLGAAGVAHPERGLRGVLGGRPSLSALYEALSRHLFSMRCVYERREVARAALEHRLQATTGVHRIEGAREARVHALGGGQRLLAWGA